MLFIDIFDETKETANFETFVGAFSDLVSHLVVVEIEEQLISWSTN
jgi:hypothetical protein